MMVDDDDAEHARGGGDGGEGHLNGEATKAESVDVLRLAGEIANAEDSCFVFAHDLDHDDLVLCHGPFHAVLAP